MVQPDVLLELVCCKLLMEFQQVSCKISQKSEIQSSFRGIKLLVNLHTEIFVTRQNSCVWTGQNVAAVLGPNKVCICISKGTEDFTKDNKSSGSWIECALVVDSLSSVDEAMRICMGVNYHRKVIISSLCLTIDNDNGIVDEDEDSTITKVVLAHF